MHILDVADVHRHALEVGRVLDVGRAAIPLIQVTIGRLDGVPAGVALEHVGIVLLEHLRPDGRGNHIADFLVARPDIAQIHRLPIAARAQRLGGQVDVGGAGDGIGDDQRRAGQVIHFDFRVHAPFEVAVARQHRSHHQVASGDACTDFGRQRARVADAGGAAVADHVEADLLQLGQHAGFFQVIGDHTRARAERGLDPRLAVQALGRGVAGEQAGTDHHRRVGGVGARGDRSDDHCAILQAEFLAIQLDVAVALGQLFVADRRAAAFVDEFGDVIVALVAVGGQADQVVAVVLLDVFEQHAVLRALRAGQRWLDLTHVQFQRGAVAGVRGVGVVPQALGLGIGFHQRDLGLAAAGKTQVGQ